MGMKQIWDGEGIPPNGCDVLINLASSGAWERYTVDGFNITKADEGYDQYTVHVVLHRFSCNNKITNSRLLGDIRPLDYREGATS